MRTPRLDERGIALVVAIFALVVIGALVAGTFLVGRLEQRIGASTVYVAQASQAADAGLADAMETDQATLDAMAVWSPSDNTDLVLATEYVGGNTNTVLRYTPTIRRLNSELFLIRSVGERLHTNGSLLATDEHGVFVRLAKATMNVNSAITVMQPIQLNGNSFSVSGINTVPPSWGDAAADWTPCDDVTENGYADDKVGIRSATNTGVGGQDDDNVEGYPTDAVSNDPTITSQTFHDFVDQTFATMSNQPGVKTLDLETPYSPAPVLDLTQVPPACDEAAPLNFGEPVHPSVLFSACYNYFPVISGTGGQTKFASGARGQGTLLINGDLEIAGSFEWTGLIIVRGSFKITGTGNKITGAVLAESVTDDNSIGGDVEIRYSSCAIGKAIQGAAVATPVAHRAWMQLY